MHRPIMRSALITGALLALLACAGVAQAHNVTVKELSCKGLTFDYSAFPSTPASETEYWSTGETVIAPTTGSSGTIMTPLPSVPPNGTTVTVSGHRTGATDGTFTVTATLSCQPPPPPPLTCTPPATPQNGICVTPPPPPAPPVPPTTPPTVTPPPVVPPPPPVVPPTRHRRHHHPKPHVVRITLGLTYLNQDPQPFRAMVAGRFVQKARYGCRIVGPSNLVQHGLVHFRVRCRSAKVLPGWKWTVDGHPVRNEHWTYTSNRGRSLNSWLFDRYVWTNPAVYGRYSIRASGKVQV